mmetsp:Transcript_39879/g.80549  ORF Transcript_39879/g.80549 Transcript_39879/m.80549 type:complete len:168 (-) Transcript_39879:48-551(-)
MVFPWISITARRALWKGSAALALGAASRGIVQPLGYSAPARCDTGPSLPGMPSSWEELVPIGGGLSVGSLLGFCSGFALKKAGKAATVMFGGIFCLQQALAYKGYIAVNWDKVEKDLTYLLDVNQDGKLDAKDLDHGYAMALKVLQYNAASVTGGFGAGFLVGVRKG